MLRWTLTLALCFVSISVARAQAKKPALLPPSESIDKAIDHYVDGLIREDKQTSAPLPDDANLVRRLTLDLVGRIPTWHETRQYLESKSPDKKRELIDRLMSSPAYARHQAQEFLVFLQNSEPNRKGAKKGPLYDYLHASIKENRPWDEMFRDMILAEENDKTKGASEFLKSRVKDLNRLTVDVSIAFFGVNVSCAQCHDHPHVEAWTQDHFYGMKSFFSRTVDVGAYLGEKDFGNVKYVPNKGAEKVSPVMFLTGKALDVPGMKEPTAEEKKKDQARIDDAKKAKKAPAPPKFSLRAKFAENALEASQRHFFARAIVNRLWQRFYFRGLVTPLDQMHIENPASHPQLMDWLARDLIDHKYDLKRLTRHLVMTQTYARSSRWDKETFPAEHYFALAQVRALTPMQLATSLKIASADPDGLPRDSLQLDKWIEQQNGSAERLAGFFVQPGDNFQVSVSEAMLFSNNDSILKELLTGPSTLVAKVLKEKSLEQRAEMAINHVLSRSAESAEINILANYLRERQDRPEEAAQQMIWVLLTSGEFRFNH